MNNKKKIIICSNYAWTIYNFRIPLIKELNKNGYSVTLVTQFDGYEKHLKKIVDKVLPLFISRKGINPFIDVLTIINLIYIFIKVRPNIALFFTIKPVIYGSIASKFFDMKSISMITGLGTAFISNNWITLVAKRLYKFSLSSASTVLFQNIDDKNFFLKHKLVNLNICKLIPGSGIDIRKFKYTAIPLNKKVTFLLIARMLKDKGVIEYADAARLMRQKYIDVTFQLLGPIEVQNRTSISKKVIFSLVKDGIVEYLGETDDVRPIIANACCIVLPSYREGTSRVLLEAASMGRPIIATNVPGCREVVEDGFNGLLCKPRNYHDLSKKIEKIIKMTPLQREIMGKNGREKVKREFTTEKVNSIYIDILDNL